MEVTTNNKGIEELLLFGYTSSKKYKHLDKKIINKLQQAVAIMQSSKNIAALSKHNGLRYEKLKGNLKEFESVRLNITWRLIFKSYEDKRIEITTIELIEISHHYD